MNDRIDSLRFFLVAGAALMLGVVCAVPALADEAGSALADYVAAPDDSFAWKVRQRTRLGQSDVVELTLTSQTWKDITWKHRLFLIVPDGVKERADALLHIDGGRWLPRFEAPPTGEDAAFPKQAVLLAGFAQQLRSPVAVLLNVPQQPIFDGKTEDAIIAYTFDKYLVTGEADWPLLLPMVKSAVRAMDAVQSFATDDRGLAIERFTVTGASKRGWTTWLTAAADERVVALAPMVIDMLNMEAQLPHQLRSLGEYSPRIHDYTDINLQHRIDSPRGQQLRRIVDPYSYRETVTQPKLLLLGTNDGFWTIDALNLYWDDLRGEKHILYVPNADHDLAMDWQRVFGGIRALHRAATGGPALPRLTWDYADADDGGATLTIEPGEAGAQVRLWSAKAETRDFRKARWSARPLTGDGGGRFVARAPGPEAGYAAVFAEVTYPRDVLPLSLSTTIRVLGEGESAASAAAAAE